MNLGNFVDADTRFPYRSGMGMVSDIRAWASRLFAPAEFGVGSVADSAGTRVHSTYPDEHSMSALSRFPWVYAAFKAKALDLSGVPIVAYRTDTNTGVRTILPGHPIARMLNRPGARRGGVSLRRQLYLDHGLTGDCYLWRSGSVLYRLHPRRVTPIVNPTLGTATGYELTRQDGTRMQLRMEDVVHVSDISWEDGPASVLGTGAIMPIHFDLVANLAVKEMTAKAAKRGRMEMMFSPSEGGLSDSQVSSILDGFERNREQGRSAFVVGRGVTAQPLGLSPRDMEFGEQDLRVMAATLAVAGVPGVRVGIPGANYGTTKQQMRTYWEGLVGEAAIFDEALSMLDPDPEVTLEHDFTNVEALQVSYTERLDRVRSWWEMGATPAEAAAYEGFVGAPVGDKLFDAASPAHRPAEKDPEQGQERVSVIAAYLAGAQRRYAARLSMPEWSSAADDEAVRLLVELERVGMDSERALALAHDVARTNDEVAYQYHRNQRDISGSPAFSARKAAALSLQLAA